jgi:hypothetical protein
MTRLVSKKILLLMAIWFLSGGLSIADKFDLTDEFQNSIPELTQALEPNLDEVREQFDDLVTPIAYLCSAERMPMPYTSSHNPFFDRPLEVALRPLHERLRTFRI